MAIRGLGKSAAIAAAVAVLAACGGPELAAPDVPTVTPVNTSTPEPPPTPTVTPVPPTATPVPPTATPAPPTMTPISQQPRRSDSLSPTPDRDAEALLRRSAAAMVDVESAHFSVTGQLEIDSAGSEILVPFTYEGDYAAPDRTSGRLTLNLVVFLLEMDIVVIGDESWTTNPQTGVWEAFPPGVSGLLNPVALISGDQLALGDASVIGEEVLAGIPTLRLEGTAQLGGLVGVDDAPATVEVWTGVDDGLVHRVRYTGAADLDALGLRLADFGVAGEASVVLEMALSEFDEPVSIERPVPR